MGVHLMSDRSKDREREAPVRLSSPKSAEPLAYYSTEFFEGQSGGSRRSAERIVPLVMELVRPGSVIDIGCGVGTWLSVFREHGARRVLGVDGDYVDRQMLQIPAEDFRPFDLTKPLRIEERFDLAVSVEVGEHLPPQAAPTFVETLTLLAPVVLFAASIPYQGGVNHLNEQWPTYWQSLFATHSYEVIDCLRRHIWDDAQVQYWYAQDAMLYASREYLANHAELAREQSRTSLGQLSVVHPRRYLELVEWEMPRAIAIQELALLIGRDELIILADEDQWDCNGQIAGRRCLPFTESDGRYNGPPGDDVYAIAELERLRTAGARWIAFAWPAFWWLEHYRGLDQHLRSKYRPVLENERLKLFNLVSR